MLTRALSNLGIHVFGIGAILLGLIGLVWRDFAAVWQPVQPEVPYRTTLAVIAALLFLAGGIGVQYWRTSKAGLVMLASLHFMAALLWLPRVIHFPQLFGTWLGFAEQFCMVLAAAMAFISFEAPSPMTSRISNTARVLFGMCVVIFGFSHFFALAITASMVPKWIPPGQTFWAVATGVAHVLAGVAILSRIKAVLAARLLTLMIVLFGALVWLPSLFTNPHRHQVWAGNAINMCLIGAAWIVADRLNQQANTRLQSRAVHLAEEAAMR